MRSVTLGTQFLTLHIEVYQNILVFEVAIRSLDLTESDISLRNRAGKLIEWVVNVILPIGLTPAWLQVFSGL